MGVCRSIAPGSFDDGCLAQDFSHQIGGFLKLYCTHYFKAGLVDDGFRQIGVGALQAYDDGYRDVADGFVGIHDALGNPVAAHDTTENIDEDGFYIAVFQDDAHGVFHALGIGCAAYIQEVVVLADEPTGNLDSRTSNEIMELLAGLHRDHGQTVVMVTHEPDVAAYAPRHVLFHDGLVAFDGPADELAAVRARGELPARREQRSA